jgi:predicted dehydrogenase (TIGR03970 family)
LHSDVLIIGAGSSGCVMAERLSADPNCRVTVVEAGSADTTEYGWVLPIGPDSAVASRYDTTLTGQPVRPAGIVRGRLVGGSGAVNGGYFCWAGPADVERWALPGWSWDEVLAHYRAIETDHDVLVGHGTDGPIPVRRSRTFAPSSQLFVDATAAHFDWRADLNDPAGPRPGLGAIPRNVDESGLRYGPGRAFLAPALQRPNLTLLTGTRAVRIGFAGSRATSVDCTGPDGSVEQTADRIVLCAGSIESAHLLLRSGVGPADELAGAGVSVVADLPVGRRCSDHPEWLIPVPWPAATGRAPIEVALSTERLEIRPYTCGFGAMTGMPGGPDPVHIGISLMHPRSRGRLRLVSADPDAPLLIEHRYDTDASDRADLRDGVEQLHEIFGSAIGSEEPTWSTAQHLSATAPMGVDDDEHAVLDARCRVRGVDGLQVVDASALPQLTGRGPHATIVMLAHRAAEFVCG